MLHFDPQTGLYPDDIATVREAVRQAWIAAFRRDGLPDLSTEPETPAGQLIDSQTAAIAAKDDEILFLANQINPLTAEGVWQDALAKISFLTRKQAQPSTAVCICSGLAGTVIPEGAVVKSAVDGSEWTNTATVTIPDNADGKVNAVFAARQRGPFAAAPNTLTQIVSITPGWDSVTNPEAAIPGQELESRAAFEQRRFRSVARNARSVAGAVYARVAELDGVLDCIVRQNRSNTPLELDGVALAPHSLYVGVLGGRDEAIAHVIYDTLSAGCEYNGATEVVITDALTGAQETIRFTRLSDLPIGIRVTVKKNEELPSDLVERIQRAVLADFYGEYESCNRQSLRVRAGSELYAARFYPVILAQGVSQLVGIEVAAPITEGVSPAWTDAVHIRIDQAPQLARENISVIIENAPRRVL